MEIYKQGTDRKVTFTFGEDITDATVTLMAVDDPDVNSGNYDLNVVDIEDNKVSFDIPLRFSKFDKNMIVKVAYDYIDDAAPCTDVAFEDVKISTPILPLDEVRSILVTPGFMQTITDADVKEIERATRYIIQSNTGQDFGHYDEVRSVHAGTGQGTVELPGRLLTARKLGSVTLTTELLTTPSKRFLYRAPSSPYADWDGSPIIENGAIYNPRSDSYVARRHWNHGYTTITGEWGWNTVPEDVQEAAKLLINDYACQESAYRDRYLGVMKAADWEVNFRTGAWAMTGNARADQLLKKYVITGGGGVL